MKKWIFIILVFLSVIVWFIPFERSITFTETRVQDPVQHFLPLKNENEFQLIFTHSIHLTDGTERYNLLPTNEFQLLSMEYTDVAIGMPGHAEEGQTLHYEYRIYTLQYNTTTLEPSTLHISNVDYKLNLP